MLAQLGLCLPIWRPGMSAADTKTHHTTMSEYQYFEFQALDRPLTREQMDELRRHSTRARITATGFVNEYHYDDFKGSPERWMAAFFDAFVHLTNWGTRWLMLRLPRALFTAEQLSAYCTPGEALTYREEGDLIVLSFYSSSEDHDWVEGEGSLGTLTPLRSALLGGDERCLYLGWLLGVQVGEVDDEDGEPPVPPGLGALDEPLRALVDFFGLDADLIAVAAEHSGPLEARPLSTEALARWVEDLAAADKGALLVSLLSEGNGHQSQHELQLLRRRARREIEAATSPANSDGGDAFTQSGDSRFRRERPESPGKRSVLTGCCQRKGRTQQRDSTRCGITGKQQGLVTFLRRTPQRLGGQLTEKLLVPPSKATQFVKAGCASDLANLG